MGIKIHKGHWGFKTTIKGKHYHLVLACGSYRSILQAYSTLKKSGLDVIINKHEDHPSEAYDLYVYEPHYLKHQKELYKGTWMGQKI